MKASAILASLLAAGGSASADSAFRMIAASKGATFDGSYLRGTSGQFVLGKKANSTCGASSPIFTNSNNTLTTYGDGKENVQIVSVDISGAAGGILSYKNYPYNLTNDDISDKFSTNTLDGIEHILYKKSTWLACPQTQDGVFSVYAEEAYTKADKQKCIPLEIVPQTVDQPEACQMI